MRKIKSDLKRAGIACPRESGFWRELEEGAGALPDEKLDADINETFLFHGTRPMTIPKIVQSGLNERLNGRGFFGCGTYLAEDMGKADQYVRIDKRYLRSGDLAPLHKLLYGEDPEKHPQDVFYVLLCRVALGYALHSFNGEVASTDGQTPVYSKLHRGYDSRELSPIPGTSGDVLHHSLVIEKTPKHEIDEDWWYGESRVWRYREFVLTHSDRIYPQYLLAVKRR